MPSGFDSSAGTMPSPVAFVPWQHQPWEPLFANVAWTFSPQVPGGLDTVEVAIGAGAAGAPITGTDRRYLTAVVSKVLDSAMVSKRVARYDGKLMWWDVSKKEATRTVAEACMRLAA